MGVVTGAVVVIGKGKVGDVVGSNNYLFLFSSFSFVFGFHSFTLLPASLNPITSLLKVCLKTAVVLLLLVVLVVVERALLFVITTATMIYR